MNHTKENPQGIDEEIQLMQNKLYTKLNYDKMTAYGRVYKLKKGEKTFPAFFKEGNDYKDVLLDDSKNCQFFFFENSRTRYESPLNITDVKIIFLLNLKNLKPDIPHRADEECKIEIQEILNRMKFFKIKSIDKGQRALSDFITDFQDMQPYHAISFNGTLRYQINC